MTIEQYEKAKELGDKILSFKAMIHALKTPECRSRLVIHQTYCKNWEGEYVPSIREYCIGDKELLEAFIQILESKRDKLKQEFEEL